jgi:hypothetical protein
MVKSSVRRAAFVLSGSAVALAGSMLPAQAATTGWRSATAVTVKDRGVMLTAVAAPAANDAWASGVSAKGSGADAREVMEHWNGRSWKPVTLPSKVAKAWANTNGAFQVIGASSGSNVWAFDQIPAGKGDTDTYLRLSGRRWTTGTLPGSSVTSGHEILLTSAEVLGNSSVWVFGGELRVSGKQVTFAPYAAHFTGSHWSTVSVPGSNEITAVSEIAPNNMWAVTGISGFAAESGSGGSVSGGSVSGASTVLHWNGSSWQAAAVQPSALPAGASLTAITAARGNRLTIGGDVANSDGDSTSAFADQFNGTAWSAPATLPKFGADGEIVSLVPNGHDGLWALSANLGAMRSQLWQNSGGRWSSPASPKFGSRLCELFQLAAASGGRSVWAAGVEGTAKSFHGVIAVEGPTPR